MLSLHSTTVPLIEALAVATTVELNKRASDVSSVTFWNINGPHGKVDKGLLWSIAVEQFTGGLKIHRVIPEASLSWLHVNKI